MNRIRISNALAPTAICSMLLAGGAHADVVTKSRKSTKPETAASLSEVVVTAQRRRENVQTVPLAVTAITSQQLDALNAQTFQDYFRTVPGLMMNEAFSTTRGFDFSLRGVSDFNDYSPQTTAATVGQYLDEIPITEAGLEIDPQLIDIERIEVLRGPQGTFFGEDSLGGTIRIITKKPDLDQFSGSAQSRISNTQGGAWNDEVDGVVNLPLISHMLALRINAFTAFDSGFVDEVCTPAPFAQPECASNGQVNERINPDWANGARSEILFRPTDAVSFNFEYVHERNKTDNGPFYEPEIGDLKIASPDAVNANVVDEANLYNLTTNISLGWADLISSSSLARRGFGEQAAGLALDYDSYAQELRLVSSKDSSRPWDYIAGLYYLRSDHTLARTIRPGSVQSSDVDNKEAAVFAELGYQMTSALSLRLGARQEYLQYGFSPTATGIVPAQGPAAKGDGPARTGRFVISDDIARGQMLYASVSRGFRQGGVNQSYYDGAINAPNPNVSLTYGPDTTTNFELGWKAAFDSNRVTFDADVYHINWDSIQISSAAPEPGFPGGYIYYYHNAGDAKIDGIEVESTARVVQGLMTTLSFSVLNPRITKSEQLLQDDPPGFYAPSYCYDGCPAREGDDIPYVSRVSGSFTLNYTHAIGSRLAGFAVVSEQYEGDRHTDFAATWEGPSQGPVLGCPVLVLGPCPVPEQITPRTVNGAPNNQYATMAASYLTNFQLGLQSDLWRLAIYANNLFNVRNQTLVLPADNAPNGDEVEVGRPRTVGLWVRRDF
jgi:outer membrane receptor protein involved in Fe transport